MKKKMKTNQAETPRQVDTTGPPADPPDRRARVLELLDEWRESVRREEELQVLADENEAAGRAIEAQAIEQNEVQYRIQDRLGELACEWFGRSPGPGHSEGWNTGFALVVAGWVVLIESDTRTDRRTIGNPIAPQDVMTLS